MLAEYEAADKINLCSTFSRATFVENGVPEHRTILTPLGCLEAEDISFAETERGGAFVVLYVGRVSIEKGVQYLLRAFSEATLAGAELWVVGAVAPEMEGVLARYRSNFRYLGVKSREELGAVYRAASVLVLPSVQEAFGLVLLEAMASGLAVIATETSGAPDIVRNGIDGFVVPSRNAEALRERLAWLYENRSKCREMGLEACNRARTCGRVASYGEAVLANFRRLLGKRGNSVAD
jgi:glycosyltransferase involved in cell wall biosynthesis